VTTYDCDLFVIGAGSGGVRAARIAAGHGARVMIAEDSRIGGTCVIRGCVPKKLMVYASRFPQAFDDAVGFGFAHAAPDFSWHRLRDSLEAEVTRLSGLYRKGLEGAGVEIVEERARLVGPNRVRLAKGREISARYILVATGGYPSREPEIPGGELGIVSDEIFRLDRMPEHMIVVGAGYIAVEFASIFSGLGVDVTLVYRGRGILRGFDEDLRGLAEEALAARGVRFRFENTVERIEELSGGRRRAHLRHGEPIMCDTLLIATGRKPNTRDIGLDEANVLRDTSDAIQVSPDSCTSVPSIYAVGDVTNRVNLTPVAIREGHAFADTVFGGRPWTVDHSVIPTAVFTTPEIGTVGLTEAQAAERHRAVDVYEARFRPMLATLSGRSERVMMKVLVDAETDRVIGVHIFGDGAAEIVQSVAIAVKMGATKADFDATIALHPSAAEELVTMRSVARRIRA
jgi:glutathione reductase (NADPH)